MRPLKRTLSAAAMAATAALAAMACTDQVGQPITGSNDVNNGSSGSGGSGGSATSPFVSVTSGKVDVLFVIDNSSSMADKQQLLAKSVPDFVQRLTNPLCLDADGVPAASQPASSSDACPTGSTRQFVPATDMRVGFVSSSLGGHGADYCSTNDPTHSVVNPNDGAHLLTRSLNASTPVPTYQNTGIVVWDANSALTPPGDSVTSDFISKVTAITLGADQKGCGFEAPLEAWYRFLVDPTPPASVDLLDPSNPFNGAVASGTDTELLDQRARFSRPDSLLLVVVLSDEDDCSVIDGQMVKDVCDDPTLDASGKPTGCNTDRVGWPAGYAEGNFQDQTRSADGRVTGKPFPANNLSSQLNAFSVVGTTFGCDETDSNFSFCMAPPTAACATAPESVDCQSCYLGIDEGCNASTKLAASADLGNLRCWNQKQRFGVDMLYPRRRYVDGLTKSRVYDRDGYLVANPLFSNGRPLGTVVLTGIVGVPWQDIARSLTDPSLGARPTTGADALDWDRIVGNPFGDGGKPRRDPADPLMIESPLSNDPAHPRVGHTQPATGEVIAGATGGTWNSVNGHDWTPPNDGDLQYSCLFNLQPDASTGHYASCGAETKDSLATSHNPVCEKPVSSQDLRGSGTYDDLPLQYRAKAYPALRTLDVIRGLGASGQVNSICAVETQDQTSAAFGYRPAVKALVDTVTPRLRK